MVENVNGRSRFGAVSILISIALIASIISACQPKPQAIVTGAPSSTGVLTCPISQFKANPQTGCFLVKDGWDKYFKITNIFVGPNVVTSGLPTGILSSIKANPNKGTSLLMTTCLTNNYAQLSTAIMIMELFNITNCVCFSNNPPCDGGPNLTIAGITMSTTTAYVQGAYGVEVYFKSSTTNPSPTNVYVYWDYETGGAAVKN